MNAFVPWISAGFAVGMFYFKKRADQKVANKIEKTDDMTHAEVKEANARRTSKTRLYDYVEMYAGPEHNLHAAYA